MDGDESQTKGSEDPIDVLEDESEEEESVEDARFRRSVSKSFDSGQKIEVEIEQIKNGSQRAFEALLERNSRLISLYAKRFTRPDLALEFDDLYWIGAVALFEAALDFKPERLVRFSTFATTVIFRKMRTQSVRKGELIRRPEKWKKIEQQIDAFETKTYMVTGAKPTTKELAAALNLQVEEVFKSHLSKCVFIDGHQRESEDDLDDFNSQIPDAVDRFSAIDEDDAVRTVLRELSDREQDVLILRLGLLGHREHTLDEVGIILKLSGERVRQIQSGAYSKLRAKRVLGKLSGSGNASAPHPPLPLL